MSRPLVGAPLNNYVQHQHFIQQQRQADLAYSNWLYQQSRQPYVSGAWEPKDTERLYVGGCYTLVAIVMLALILGLTFGNNYELIKYKILDTNNDSTSQCTFYCTYRKANQKSGYCVNTIHYPDSLKSLGLATFIMCSIFSVIYGTLIIILPWWCVKEWRFHILIAMIISCSMYIIGGFIWIIGDGCGTICNENGGKITTVDSQDKFTYESCQREKIYIWWPIVSAMIGIILALAAFVFLKKQNK